MTSLQGFRNDRGVASVIPIGFYPVLAEAAENLSTLLTYARLDTAVN